MESRRALAGARAALALTSLVAIMSFLTGVANIGVTGVTGPLAGVVPAAVARIAGFTGALTGFLMLASAVGLRRRLRVAWVMAVVLLPVTAVQGLAQASLFSLPLVVLSVLALPAVLGNYRRFDNRVDLSTVQLAALSAVGGTLVYGTVGAYALRDSFQTIATPTDALYYTIVTASTVGYGDAVPDAAGAGAQQARLFATSLVLLGTASFAVALGSLIGPAIEARLSHALGTMTEKQLDLLEDHVIVLGYGDLTEPIVDELQATTPFVVVTPDTDAATELRARDVDVLTADPSDEEPLNQAAITDARAVVAATNDDAQDALAILTAKSLNPEAHVVAAATDRENVEKLRRAGASVVISPAVIGGHLLVESALGGEDAESIAEGLLGEAGDDQR